MRTLNKALLALVAGSLVSVGAQAAMFNTGAVGEPYVGIKAGKFDVDIDNRDNDDPTAYGIYGGYNFDPNFGIELEYITSSDEDVKLSGVKTGEYSVDTFGAYGTYRYYFPNSGMYAKGKLGFANNSVDYDPITGASSDEDDTGVAAGIGLGFAINPNVNIEAEYARVDSDIDMMTIGAHMKF